MGKPLIDRTGQRYERLTVTGRADNYRGNAQWHCLCDCGRRLVALGNDLARGKVKSCGCYNAERIVKHGMARSPVYRVWQAMIQRCENPKCDAYENYGARGITVCDEWHDFERFIADMGARPKGFSIDRIDNDQGYCKANCRWASTTQQLNNRRNNRMVELDGRKQTIAEWAEEKGIVWSVLRGRLDRYGWSIEEALTTPVKKYASRS
jgi:hypothetical protein